MLHVLLLILKILGIVLLAVLGLILVIALLILFVPVRYRLDGNGDKDRKGYGSGDALVSWLLHLATLRAVYGEDGLTVRARILFFTLFEDTIFGGNDAEETGDDLDGILEEAESAGEPEAGFVGSVENAETGGPVPEKLTVPEEKPAAEIVGPAAEPETVPEKPPVAEEKPTMEIVEPAAGPEAAPDEGPVSEGPPVPKEKPEPEKKAKKKKRPAPESGRKGAVTRIQDVFQKIGCKIREICGKLKKGQELYEKIRDFFEDTENQKTIALLWRQTKKLFRHILPRKVSGNVRFGFDDPYRTGQVLAAVSPFYSIYGKSLALDPVFDGTALDGEIHIRGRIRAATLLWIAVRVFLNRNFRKLLREWRK